jgi:hypothetical protein
MATCSSAEAVSDQYFVTGFDEVSDCLQRIVLPVAGNVRGGKDAVASRRNRLTLLLPEVRN